MRFSRAIHAALALSLFGVAMGCAGSHEARRFTSTEIVWEDPDRRPIPQPEKFWTGLYWDGADKMLFRPLSHFWLFENAGPASNTNALDEVPNSSWYTNRMAIRTLSPESIADASCEREIDTSAVWQVVAGKIDGANPGFFVEDTSDGTRYLLKFDSEEQKERATAADVIGSKVYWAAGFSVPCNRIVAFDPAILEIAEDATKENDLGQETPITRRDIEFATQHAPRLEDGRVRASASEFLPGTPLGPFRYEETRSDDANDVIPHEDRRELRGSKVLAAWLNHFDARQANTFTSFIEDPERKGMGYVQHHFIDWGDCFGSQWDSERMSRRFGHSWYFDAPHVVGDFFSLGLIPRPWDSVVEYQGGGDIFGYFDVANFAPESWHNGYPHPAFSRADEVDLFWGAKIVSRFSDSHVRRLVEEGHFTNPAHSRYLERTLIGRRDKIVHHYFERISPFDLPRTRDRQFCIDDLGVTQGYYSPEDSFYEFRVRGDHEATSRLDAEEGRVCVTVGADLFEREDYFVVDLRVRRSHQSRPARPTSLHFQRKGDALKVAGIDRY